MSIREAPIGIPTDLGRMSEYISCWFPEGAHTPVVLESGLVDEGRFGTFFQSHIDRRQELIAASQKLRGYPARIAAREVASYKAKLAELDSYVRGPATFTRWRARGIGHGLEAGSEVVISREAIIAEQVGFIERFVHDRRTLAMRRGPAGYFNPWFRVIHTIPPELRVGLAIAIGGLAVYAAYRIVKSLRD